MPGQTIENEKYLHTGALIQCADTFLFITGNSNISILCYRAKGQHSKNHQAWCHEFVNGYFVFTFLFQNAMGLQIKSSCLSKSGTFTDKMMVMMMINVKKVPTKQHLKTFSLDRTHRKWKKGSTSVVGHFRNQQKKIDGSDEFSMYRVWLWQLVWFKRDFSVQILITDGQNLNTSICLTVFVRQEGTATSRNWSSWDIWVVRVQRKGGAQHDVRWQVVEGSMSL